MSSRRQIRRWIVQQGLSVCGLVALVFASATPAAVAQERSEQKPADQKQPKAKPSADKPAADRSKEDRKSTDTQPTDSKQTSAEDRQKAKRNEAAATNDTQAAMDFARQHHPELATLLERLRKAAPREYRAAMADLERSRVRLERSQERTPDRYELELSEWKINSRIRLIVARMAMRDDPDLQNELQVALQERLAVRRTLLEDERARLERRLTRINEQLQNQAEHQDQWIEREKESLLRTANGAARRAGSAKTETAKKKPSSNAAADAVDQKSKSSDAN